jgi:hypothetical protein
MGDDFVTDVDGGGGAPGGGRATGLRCENWVGLLIHPFDVGGSSSVSWYSLELTVYDCRCGCLCSGVVVDGTTDPAEDVHLMRDDFVTDVRVDDSAVAAGGIRGLRGGTRTGVTCEDWIGFWTDATDVGESSSMSSYSLESAGCDCGLNFTIDPAEGVDFIGDDFVDGGKITKDLTVYLFSRI